MIAAPVACSRIVGINEGIISTRDRLFSGMKERRTACVGSKYGIDR